MKKVILTIAAIATVAIPALSQEKVLKPSKFGDNWFLQLQGGLSYTLSEDLKHASFDDVIAPHVAFSFGKHFTPNFGGRIQVGGWQSKNYIHETDVVTESTYKVKYLQVSADAMVNMTNLFRTYQPERVFNFYGFAGLGYVHGYKDSPKGVPTTNSIVPRVGFIADFRLNEFASVNLELAGNLMRDDFNGRTQGTHYDGTVNALLGFKFNLSKSGFEYADIADPNELRRLNDQINDQRASLSDKDSEISRLRTELANKPAPQVIVQETKEVKEQTEVLMNAVVVFRLGSAKLEQNQDINIYNAARYLKDNPSVNVIVTGYADKSTGTAAINQKLSEQRAEAVAKILIDKYAISPSRITTKASGDKEQLFPTDEWNRVVVFTAVSK